MISAKVIADSKSPRGSRLTTLEVVMPRFILAEFNTHRVFSRNSASSRAIPVSKQIAKIRETPFKPLQWKYNQPGMQAAKWMEEEDAKLAEKLWLRAAEFACEIAEEFANIGPEQVDTGKPLGLHKQWANRVLEPFMYHTVIVSSTEWYNFMVQRNSNLAQPEIEAVAVAINEAMTYSRPKNLEYGEWHLPYIQTADLAFDIEAQKKFSVARCARVSYLTHDGKVNGHTDVDLFGKLVSANPPHWSPLEHVATPWKPKNHWYSKKNPAPLGNFEEWYQLRHNVGIKDPKRFL